MKGLRLAGVLLAGAVACCAAASRSFSNTVQPFISKNCVGCHNAKLMSGSLDLQDRKPADFAGKDREIWEKVAAKVKVGEMPPKPLPPLPSRDVQTFTAWITSEYSRIDRNARPDPGRVTARRLNRYEYNNTIRDLAGVNFRPADDFPADDSGYGFDNIGDVLSISPVLMEKYLSAAEQIAKKAIAADPLPKPTLTREKATISTDNPGEIQLKHKITVEGEYDLRATLAGLTSPFKSKDTLPHTLSIFVDGKQVQHEQIDPAPERRRTTDTRVPLTPGLHTIRAELAGPSCDIKTQLRVDYLDIKGPFHPVAPPLPESHKRIFICGHENGGHHNPKCARIIVTNLARRAFRRPVTAEEVNNYTRFIDMAQKEGDSFEQGVRVALEAILVSPEFLFRIERDPKPNDPTATHRIGDFELATRLSYFLWSSMPDEELFQAAEKGELRKPDLLEAQVKRMLRDPKAFALVENFGGQWLELRNLDTVQPDPKKFPEFDKDLRSAMRRETQLFFQSIVREDRSILDFLNAKYTFMNERLAKFYGIPGITGPEFRRVELPENSESGQRMGVLTQASVLTISSYPNRTSPVLRGKFILENVLNTPPPPPPPDVPLLENSGGNTGTLRQQMEKHRSNAICASCHSKMDPLGFGLENYDAIGRWRSSEGGLPIDASGTLPDGKSFNSPVEMMSILAGNRDAFARCLTEKLLTYALGRGLERYDKPSIQSISRRAAARDYRFSSLILEIVNSMPFQMRRGDAPVRTALESRR
jgi:hypothetical protein